MSSIVPKRLFSQEVKTLPRHVGKKFSEKPQAAAFFFFFSPSPFHDMSLMIPVIKAFNDVKTSHSVQ